MVDAVQSATAEYRNEQDLVQQFLEEKCEMHAEYSLTKVSYIKPGREWCEAAGETEAAKSGKKWLTHQMTNRGYQQGGGQNRTLFGIKLKK